MVPNLIVHKSVYQGLVCLGLGGWMGREKKGKIYKLKKIRSVILSEKKNAKMQVSK